MAKSFEEITDGWKWEEGFAHQISLIIEPTGANAGRLGVVWGGATSEATITKQDAKRLAKILDGYMQ